MLVSVGRADSHGIGLENTKVKIDDRGFVQIDERSRTADPHILAIGDVAGEPMLAHKASHEGRVAVEASTANRPRSNRWPFRPSSSPIRRSPGRSHRGARPRATAANVEIAVTPGPPVAAPSLGRTEGMTKLAHRPRRPTACSAVGIVGPGAGELIAEASWRSKWAARPATSPNRSTHIPRSAKRPRSPPKSTSARRPRSTARTATRRRCSGMQCSSHTLCAAVRPGM